MKVATILVLAVLCFTVLSRPHHPRLPKEQVEKAVQGLQDLQSNQDKQAFFVDSHLVQLEDGTSGFYLEDFEDLLTAVGQSVGLPRPPCHVIAREFNSTSNGAQTINREQAIQAIANFANHTINFLQHKGEKHCHRHSKSEHTQERSHGRFHHRRHSHDRSEGIERPEEEGREQRHERRGHHERRGDKEGHHRRWIEERRERKEDGERRGHHERRGNEEGHERREHRRRRWGEEKGEGHEFGHHRFGGFRRHFEDKPLRRCFGGEQPQPQLEVQPQPESQPSENVPQDEVGVVQI